MPRSRAWRSFCSSAPRGRVASHGGDSPPSARSGWLGVARICRCTGSRTSSRARCSASAWRLPSSAPRRLDPSAPLLSSGRRAPSRGNAPALACASSTRDDATCPGGRDPRAVTENGAPPPADAAAGDRSLAILLAMAMFVLVVDTSLMNVSISAVVHDLGTTASSVQSAIALEALVSAAFILIGSKIGDLIGRKRAFILGLLGYAVGAL